jgi:hypothetical protein
MGASTWILGMRIMRDRPSGTITLDQELYVTKALKRLKLDECKFFTTPASTGAAAVGDEDGLGGLADRDHYMQLVGTLLYAAISTRPDIANAVLRLTRKMQVPLKRDLFAAERVLRYLAGTKSNGLIFGRNKNASSGMAVSAYADADWGNNKEDRKSVTGWIAKVNGDVISWASKTQKTIAQSTCEAELYAEAAGINEMLWLRGILSELGLEVDEPSVIYGDNQSTVAISKNGIKGERTKHVDIKYHFIKDQVDQGVVKVQWISTTEQQADICTKPLAIESFKKFRMTLMID